MKLKEKKMEKLINNAEVILNKYDNDYIRPAETFIHNFDRYIFHAIEEVYEARLASNEEFVEEVADILNYTATMVNILKLNLKYKGSIKLRSLPKNKEIPIKRQKELLAFIYDDLVSMRRLFPQRKWHKNEPMEDFQEVLDKCLQICIQVMSALLDLIGYDKLINVAIKKQQYIIGLEKDLPVCKKTDECLMKRGNNCTDKNLQCLFKK